MNKALITINYEWLQIIDELEQNEGEVTKEIQERLFINENELKQKVDGYCNVINSLKGDINTIEDKITTLQTKIKSKEKVIERLKDCLKLGLNMYGESNPKTVGKKIKTLEHTIWNVFNKPLIIDESSLDLNELNSFTNFTLKNKFNTEQLLKLKEFIEKDLQVEVEDIYSLDKKAIKTSIEQGNKYTGISIDENANFITIR